MKTKPTLEEVQLAVFSAIEETLIDLNIDYKVDKNTDFSLFGSNNIIDSIALVNILVATEEKIMNQFDEQITIASEKAFSQKSSPFKTFNTLALFVHEIIKSA